MSYNAIIWGSTFKTHLEPLVKQHNRIMTTMGDTNDNSVGSINELCSRFKILKFTDVYNYFAVIHVFKKMREGKYLSNHDLNLRNQGLAVPVYQRLTTTQHSIDFCGPLVFNELPHAIRNTATLGNI